MGKKDKSGKIDIIPQGVPAPYGIRKTYNHVIPIKKKRVNSLVKMKPLKQRDNVFQVPQFCPPGYKRQEFDLYREEFQRIRELTKEDLKQILKLNKQDHSPQAKQELLNRCADGYALGKIKTCPHCFGNIPVYDKYKGNYYCAGYRQEEQFIKCDSTFSREELSRIKPWNNNFQDRETKRIERTQRKLKNQRQYQIQYKKNKKQRLKALQMKEKGIEEETYNSKRKDANEKQQKTETENQQKTKKEHKDDEQSQEDQKQPEQGQKQAEQDQKQAEESQEGYKEGITQKQDQEQSENDGENEQKTQKPET